MAFPTILIDSATGSDSTASGAGPSTSHNGSTGRTRNSSGMLQFGLFGYTTDISDVVISGSNVLYAAISTAGQRNFSAIIGRKNTRETGTDAAIVSGTTALTVGSTTGWTNGNVIKITGAGAAGADLYTTVTILTGTTATTADAAGTTVGPSAAWENPKQVSLASSQGMNTGTTNTAWAIGGKRASLGSSSSLKLIDNNSSSGDAMAGWIIEFQSGHTETATGRWQIRRSGDTTNGPIIVRGVAAAATRPILTNNQNDLFFILNGNYQQLNGFDCKNSNATKTASYAVLMGSTLVGQVVRDLKVSDSSNKFWRGIYFGSSSRGLLYGCDIGNTASHGIFVQDTPRLGSIFANYIHSCTGTGIRADNVDFFYNLCLQYNVIAGCGSGGIYLKSSNTDSNRSFSIIGNTIDSNTGDGLQVDFSGDALACSQVTNNIFSNNSGYGVNWSGGSVTEIYLFAYGVVMLNNDFYNNTSGKYTPTGLDTAGISVNESTLDPTFTNAGAGDYSIGTNLKALGFPSSTLLGSTTRSYVDIGAAQRQEQGTGSLLLYAVE